MIAQFAIALLGVSAILCMQQPDKHPARRWGPVLGLLGQPFWIYSAWAAGMYGMLAITLIYTVVWAAGVWRLWRPA